MRRILIVSAVLAALALMPAGAAAAPPDFHDHFTESFTDPDFCGTGAAVDVTQTIVANGYDQSDTVFRVSFSVRETLIYNGLTLRSQAAGHAKALATDGVFSGAHTEVVAESGLRSKLWLPGQGVLTSDHGLLLYQLTFDDNGELVDVTVLKDAGGHPDFSDPVWCAAASAAFGLQFTP